MKKISVLFLLELLQSLLNILVFIDNLISSHELRQFFFLLKFLLPHRLQTFFPQFPFDRIYNRVGHLEVFRCCCFVFAVKK